MIDNKIDRLTELLLDISNSLIETKEMSFNTAKFFDFAISKPNDINKYVFSFESIDEFSVVVNKSCSEITKDVAKNVVVKLLLKNGKNLDEKFTLTLITT
jgi:hypothetical protein